MYKSTPLSDHFFSLNRLFYVLSRFEFCCADICEETNKIIISALVSVSIEKTSNKHQGYNISILVSHYTKNVGTLHLKELLYTCVFGTINKRAGSLESYLE